MNYEQQKVRTWILEHTALNHTKLEELAAIPKDSLRHFMKERRSLSEDNLSKLITVLINYGFVES